MHLEYSHVDVFTKRPYAQRSPRKKRLGTVGRQTLLTR